MEQTAMALRWLSVAAMVACTCGRAAAVDIGGFSPTAAPQSAPAAYPYPERTASTMEQLPPGVASASPSTAAARRPLPLSAPAEADARRDQLAQQMTPLATGAASLGIVLGLFLLVVLVARRGIPRGTAALPREAVEVLGRAPFVARQHVHLVRCSNKLLLVCVSPTSTHTLTEITDPAEVDQLLALCQEPRSGGSALAQWLRPFGNRRRDRGVYDRHDDAELDFAHLEALQRSGQEAHA